MESKASGQQDVTHHCHSRLLSMSDHISSGGIPCNTIRAIRIPCLPTDIPDFTRSQMDHIRIHLLIKYILLYFVSAEAKRKSEGLCNIFTDFSNSVVSEINQPKQYDSP